MFPEENNNTDLSQQPLTQKTPNIEWRRFFRMHPHLKKWGGIVLASALTSLFVIAVAGIIGWQYRGKIAALLVSTIPAPVPAAPLPLAAADVPASPPVQLEAPKELSVTEVVQKVNPSVVSIEVSQANSIFSRVVGKGTGFFVSGDGYIVTNRHVVNFSSATYAVTTAAGKKYAATLVAKDPVFDLAVLKVAGSGFPAVTLGDSDSLELGQSVVAIGFALGQFENSISVGVISGLSRSIVAGGGGSTEQLDRVIQTDAAINPGNSGGPLINLKGEVIGVNVAVAQGSQSIGFAIPAKDVAQVVDSVKAYGTIIRPYLGISYTQVTAAVQKQLDLAHDYGVLVSAVLPDTPASRAGIQTGDVILSIDGVKVDGDPSFSGIIRDKKVGQSVSLVIVRDGSQSTVKAVLARAPEL